MDIVKRLQLYIEVENALSAFFTAVPFCVTECIPREISLYPREKTEGKEALGTPGKYGCCVTDSYKLAVTNEAERHLVVQQRQHVREGEVDQEFGCDMRDKQGCRIMQYRSPICIAYLCPSFSDHLDRKFSIFYNPPGARKALEELLSTGQNEQEVHTAIQAIEQATERARSGIKGKEYIRIFD